MGNNKTELDANRLTIPKRGPQEDRRASLVVAQTMRESGHGNEAILDVLDALALLPGTEHKRDMSCLPLTNRPKESGCVPTTSRDGYVPS